MFINRFRLQEAVADDKGGGNGDANKGGDWRTTTFGAEAAPVLKDFKEPKDFLTAFTAANTELTTLKAAPAGDWRKTLAGDDPTAQQFLGRFTDPKAFMKTVNEAQTKLRSGDFAKPLPKDATPEQRTEWRKANGIPEKPEDYFANLPTGIVIGAEDKPLFDSFAKIAHDSNASPELMHAAAKWYYDGQTAAKAEEHKADQADSQAAISALRNEWGNDYAPNMSIIKNFMEGLPGDLKERLMDATLGDGTRAFNDVDFVKLIASVARERNPAAHLLPAGGDGSIKGIQSEIDAIEKVMKTDRNAYNKDESMQERYRNLLDARLKLQKQVA